VNETVLKEIKEHAQSCQTEIGGVLLGDLRKDKGSIEVTGTIRAKHTISKEYQVTFTASTWRHIQKEKKERFEDKEILGWYHSHVGKDAHSHFTFTDFDFQRKMFKKDWQVAIVYDAVRGHYGVYKWKDGKVVRCTFPSLSRKGRAYCRFIELSTVSSSTHAP
jgi:proteasome lid subunit RPN8/RPN11